ncbi:hypothetical protein GCM10010358_42990 [Streptomyces minutiscleroticus]|uniref:Uncharacterized protein n=1 Tax=Streptomyces minutiscleroticus TaxID=68238 RepID=A0A918U2T6_9ACTN|nr:hypothetical protein GCM10010358_42990 [Streptomyces minutiscleroticus]
MAQGLTEQPLRLGAHTQDAAVLRPGQRAARPPVTVPDLMHGAIMLGPARTRTRTRN